TGHNIANYNAVFNMKFAIDSNHRDYFQKNHTIEFDGLLNENQLVVLKSRLNETLKARLKEKKVALPAPENLFREGRDLWRTDEPLRKIVAHRKFGEIASELISQKPLRLGYDQYISPPPPQILLGHQQTTYALLLSKVLSLEELSSLQ